MTALFAAAMTAAGIVSPIWGRRRAGAAGVWLVLSAADGGPAGVWLVLSAADGGPAGVWLVLSAADGGADGLGPFVETDEVCGVAATVGSDEPDEFG